MGPDVDKWLACRSPRRHSRRQLPPLPDPIGVAGAFAGTADFGAGSGIGRALVADLVQSGGSVAAVDLDEAGAVAAAGKVLEAVGMGPRMMHKPNSGIDDKQGKEIFEFLVYDQINRKDKNPKAFFPALSDEQIEKLKKQ